MDASPGLMAMPTTTIIYLIKGGDDDVLATVANISSEG